MTRRTFTDLTAIESFDDRFLYLKLGSRISDRTFGSERYLNQAFYSSGEWKRLRHQIIARDNGLDMAHPDFPIAGQIYIHHLNPMTPETLINKDPSAMDVENLVCVSARTHNAIHFSDINLLPRPFLSRQPGDTMLWEPA